MPNAQGGSATTYTYAQLQGLWIQAGGPRALAPVAGAIALAESRGVPDVVNPTDNNGTQSSYGLWQISNGTHTPPAANWQDPHVNANLAVAKWKAAGDSFDPWGTYNSGAYKSFMSNRTTPQAVPGSAPAAPAASPGADCLMHFTLPTVVSLPVVGGIGGGQICLMSKSEARAFIGGSLILAGGIVAVIGLTILLAGAATESKAAGKVADAVAVVPVPGSQAVAAGIHRARQAPARRQAAARKRASAPKPKPKAKPAPKPAPKPKAAPKAKAQPKGP